MAEIACKMGHFVSEEQFNVWHTQRVGYGHFFQWTFQYIIDRNCAVLPKTSNIHSRQMMLLHEGGADDNGKRRERASDDGAA
jgi:hypothetical protein